MSAIRFTTFILILGMLVVLSGCGGGGRARTVSGTSGVKLAITFPAGQATSRTMPGSTTRVMIYILDENKTDNLVPPTEVHRTSDAQQTVQATIGNIPSGPCWVRALAYFGDEGISMAGAEKEVVIVAGQTQSVTIDMGLLPVRITLDPGEISLYVDGIAYTKTAVPGSTRQITAHCYDIDDNEITGHLTWESSHPEIATVDQTGLVTAVAPGSDCSITATDTMSGAQGYASVWVGIYAY